MEDTKHVSPFMPMFETFRSELDEHHDRRERIIKASRDITALSKKLSVTSAQDWACSILTLWQYLLPAAVG